MKICVQVIDGNANRARNLKALVVQIGKEVAKECGVDTELECGTIGNAYEAESTRRECHFAFVHHNDARLRECYDWGPHEYFYSGGGVKAEFRDSSNWFKAAVSPDRLPPREQVESLIRWLYERVLRPTEAPKSPPEIPPEDDAAHGELLQVAVIGWTLKDDDRIDRLGEETINQMLDSLPSERLSDALRKAVSDIQSKIKKLVVPGSITKDEWKMHRSEIKDLGDKLLAAARGALEGGSAGLGPRATVP